MFEIVAAEISPLHTAGCRALGKQPERMQKDVPHGAEMISLHFTIYTLSANSRDGISSIL